MGILFTANRPNAVVKGPLDAGLVHSRTQKPLPAVSEIPIYFASRSMFAKDFNFLKRQKNPSVSARGHGHGHGHGHSRTSHCEAISRLSVKAS